MGGTCTLNVLLQVMPLTKLVATMFACGHAINTMFPSIKDLGVRRGLWGSRTMSTGLMRSAQAVCCKEATTIPTLKHGFRSDKGLAGGISLLSSETTCTQGVANKLHMALQGFAHHEGVVLGKSLHIMGKPKHFFLKDGTDVRKLSPGKHLAITNMAKMSRASENGSQMAHINVSKLSTTRSGQPCCSQSVE